MVGDIFWLGAHKTGTTFLQKSLDLSQEALREARIDYVELAEFRSRYTRPLLNKPRSSKPAPSLSADRESWTRLVFDENILSLVQDALSKRGQYLGASRRAGIVYEYLDLESPQLYLGVRSPVTFVPSLYCEAIKALGFGKFRQFLKTPLHKLSWQPLMISLLKRFPTVRLNIYRHEDLRGNERKLLSVVTGLPEEKFTVLENVERIGFSARAIAEIETIGLERAVTLQDRAKAVARFPRNEVNTGYMPWETWEIEELSQIYASDVDFIKSTERIRFLPL